MLKRNCTLSGKKGRQREMKVSIVVPVYNAEKYLEECVLSVVNQTNENWELILVNDGSTDKSAEICNLYAERYEGKIRAFHKKNEGQFLARQYGIERSTGEYVGFLDADDFLSDTYIDSLQSHIEESYMADVLCFGFFDWDEEIIRENKVTTLCEELFITQNDRKKVYEQIVEGILPGAMWSKVFKKDHILKVKLDMDVVKDKRYGEDAFQSFSFIGEADSILYLEDVLYYYRNNPYGESQGYEKRKLDHFNHKFLFKRIADMLPNWELEEQYEKILYARNFNETVYHMLMFYRATKKPTRKIKTIQFDWSSYLLDETLASISKNENARKSYIKVWTAFQRKAYLEIVIRELLKKVIGW